MSVSIKTAREIELMRESCHLLEKVHDELAKAIRPGISTWEIDHLGEEMSEVSDAPRISFIIMDILHPSVYL